MHQLELNGVVGIDFDSSAVASQLRVLDGPVSVQLNSGGGVASEGAAIHALLVAHPGGVNVDILGIAASAASLIAMAGSKITMRAGSVMMVHDPMNITIGNSDDHAKTIAELEAYAGAYARIYASRTGRSAAEARQIMKRETWFDGPEAVAAGFATHTDERRAEPFAAYDYKVYAKAEQAFAHADPSRASWKRTVAQINSPTEDRSVVWVR